MPESRSFQCWHSSCGVRMFEKSSSEPCLSVPTWMAASRAESSASSVARVFLSSCPAHFGSCSSIGAKSCLILSCNVCSGDAASVDITTAVVMFSAVSWSAEHFVNTTPEFVAAPPGPLKPTVLEHERSLLPFEVVTTLTCSVRTDGCSRKSCMAWLLCSCAVSSDAGSAQRPEGADAPRASTAHRVRWSRRGSVIAAKVSADGVRCRQHELSAARQLARKAQSSAARQALRQRHVGGRLGETAQKTPSRPRLKPRPKKGACIRLQRPMTS